MSLYHGEVWIGVPVRCYTECNTHQRWNADTVSMGDGTRSAMELRISGSRVDMVLQM